MGILLFNVFYLIADQDISKELGIGSGWDGIEPLKRKSSTYYG